MFAMCCGGCAVFSVIGERERQVVRQEMADADALWKAGKKHDAVAKYRPRLDSSLIDDQTRPVAFGRTIDLAFESGDVSEGQRVIEMASSRRVSPSVNSPQAKAAVAAFEDDRRRVAAEKKQVQAKDDRETRLKRLESSRKLEDNVRALIERECVRRNLNAEVTDFDLVHKGGNEYEGLLKFADGDRLSVRVVSDAKKFLVTFPGE
jgi:hypothetical protein